MVEDGSPAAQPRIFLYAENWPAHERVATTGLDRALVPIISALDHDASAVLLAPRSARACLIPLHPLVKHHVVWPGSLVTLLDEAVRRAGFIGCSGIIRSALRRSVGRDGGTLLSVLGGDPGSYVRAGQLAQKAGLRHIIYSVDDPFAWSKARQASHPALHGLTKPAATWMRKAEALLAITPQLAQTLTIKTGRGCRPLALPYIELPVAARQLKRQAIYVGNMSHLYADSFAQIVASIGRLRLRGVEITLRATFSPAALDGVLPSVPDYLYLGRIDDRRSFLEAIAESTVAVCPIAFDPSQAMVRSSFPSKLLDYLAQARCILVHGPRDSVAAQYLLERGLPFVTSDEHTLDQALLQIFDTAPDHSDRYYSALERAHGPRPFRNSLMDTVISGTLRT